MIHRASGHYEIKVFLEDFACADGPAPILLNFAAGSTFKVNINVGGVAEPEVAADAVFNPGSAKIIFDRAGGVVEGCRFNFTLGDAKNTESNAKE